jgi:ferric-dicitrate binding protein FerR (iron transport regulator)
VKIGPESKLYEPDGFPSKIHAIRFEGTAQFEVPPLANAEALKFHVVADRTHFIGNGATFAISSFPADSNAMIQVRKGTISVKNDKGTRILNENQTLLIDASGLHPLTDAQRDAAFGWIDGKVTSNRHLREAIATMTRWFNMDIKVPDLPLLDRDAQFSVPLDSSRAAIAQIEKSANVKFGYEGDTKVFRDAAAKK